MMALKLLPIVQVILILFPQNYAYPTVYGTKKYGRSNPQQGISFGNTMQAYQPMFRTHRYPVKYYDWYPYTQSGDDYFYPQESISYPMYYPPARTSKYEVYQAVLPYYDRPLMGRDFGYDPDPVGEIEEEMMQESEREQREDSQPIGHEMYYENDNSSPENLNDVNAAFLQNLIMSQIYKDSLDKSNYYGNDDVYGKVDVYAPENHHDYFNDDKDVVELKQLSKPHQKHQKEPSNEDRLHWFTSSGSKSTKDKKSEMYKTFLFSDKSIKKTDMKAKMDTTQIPILTTTIPPKRGVNGQKEEVLLRPATPVKYPFDLPMNNILNKKDRQRTPSVYDTIKKMLDLEKSLENPNEFKAPMRKRIITSEDNLIRQLSVLKKQ